MIAIYLISALALASAAPRYPYIRQRLDLQSPDPFNSYLRNDDIFETNRFWKELSDEISMLDQALNGFHQHFPSGLTEEKVEGNQYKITIPMVGFSEGEIVVKAREGLLMVQATHKFQNNNMNTYMNLRSLPTNVNVSGTWTYKDDVLTILFPLKSKTETTTELVTDAPKEQSREEMENTSEDAQTGDADIGLTAGDKDAEILTNEIPNKGGVEATTYAVDFSDEIEFVPVRYKK